MRVILYSMGSQGDVRPFLLLGQELKRRGHEVTLAAFSTFRKPAEKAGLGFYPLAGDAVELMSSIMAPGVSGPAYLLQIKKSLKTILPVLLQDLLKASEGAELMVCNFFGSMYYSVAEYRHIPCVQAAFFPVDPTGERAISSAPFRSLGKGWNRFSYRAGYWLISLLEKHYLSAWRYEHGMRVRGLATKPDYRIGDDEVHVLYAVSSALMPRPSDWNDRIGMTGFWQQETEQNQELPLPDELTDFLNHGDKPVYVGFGSMVSGNMRETMQAVLQGIKRSGLRAVVSQGWSDSLEGLEIPDNVYVCGNIPHAAIFPHVRAVVHHGGAGTTAFALRYGLPTLIVPFGGDQPIWGECVFRQGCGPKPLPRSRLTAGSFAKALQALTRNEASYAANARRIGEQLRQEHGVTDAADRIEAIMNENRGGNGHAAG